MTLLLSPFEMAADLLDPQPSEEQIERGMEIWREIRRPSQCAPTTPRDWYLWLILAGRGWGKTRTGAEWLIDEMIAFPHYWYAMIGPTTDDVRDIMFEGESGLLACLDARGIKYHWNKQLLQLKIAGGARVDGFTAERPERVRGPNLRAVWGDEPASWRYGQAVWDTMQFAIRKGDVRVCMTGTPKATPFVKYLVELADVITKGTTEENRANLSEKYYSKVILPYVGTRLGRQELNAEILEDVEGALWKLSLIEQHRVGGVPMHEEVINNEWVQVAELIEILVGLDPSMSNKSKKNNITGLSQRESDECGIMASGLGEDGHAYILADHSGRMGTNTWATSSLDVYDAYEADRIIAEVNNGGDLVEFALKAVCKAQGRPMPSFTQIHASRGKRVRMEPVHALYEQGMVHHVGTLPKLEDEMTSWVEGAPGAKSPNRIDAMVYDVSEHLLRKQGRRLGYSVS
jgi:phage terminase large subunit-like protein